MERHSQGTVDQLDFSSVLKRQSEPGMKLTFTIPTDVTGGAEQISRTTLKNFIKDARKALLDAGSSEAQTDGLFADVGALLEDSMYWRQRSRGLIIFAADEFFLPVRVPIELDAGLTVGEYFNLLPLAPVLASDRKLYVLALSKNSVRLFETTRNVIEELPLEGIPASFDDVIDELPERSVDVRGGSAGVGGTPSFQGPDGDIDRALVEKYIRAVGQAVGVRLGTARSQKLVLAAVAEYQPLFKAACPYPAIFDGVVAGNPEHLQPDDLRSAAWRLVNAAENAHEAEEENDARSKAHAGKGSFDLVETAQAADDGKVATLFLPRDTSQIDIDLREYANRALIGTLKASGTVRTLGAVESPGLAVFRY